MCCNLFVLHFRVTPCLVVAVQPCMERILIKKNNVWHYEDANTDLIRRAIDTFEWDRALVSTNVQEKIFILNKTILNILLFHTKH